MAYSTEHSPEEIEREIELDRQRIGAKLDEIQNRMSPGQLVDEALAYAKGSGGAEFLSNLTGSMKTNPIPVALMGISLAWLMSGQKSHSAIEFFSRRASACSGDRISAPHRTCSTGWYAPVQPFY